jgi:hypothetical protein
MISFETIVHPNVPILFRITISQVSSDFLLDLNHSLLGNADYSNFCKIFSRMLRPYMRLGNQTLAKTPETQKAPLIEERFESAKN